MNQHQRNPVRLFMLILVAFLLPAISGCSSAGTQVQAGFGGSADDILKAIGRLADDAARSAKGNGNTTELKRITGQLDDLLGRAPRTSTLTDSQKAAVKRAAQQAALAAAVAKALGASDEVAGLITTDAVEMIKTFQLNRTTRPSRALQAKLETSARSVLKDTTCQILLSVGTPKQAPPLTATARPSPPAFGSPGTPTMPTRQSVYNKLKTTIDGADSLISTAKLSLDLPGLSSRLLSKASGYVTKVKNSVTVGSWDNTVATRAYLQLCVFSK